MMVVRVVFCEVGLAGWRGGEVGLMGEMGGVGDLVVRFVLGVGVFSGRVAQ